MKIFNNIKANYALKDSIKDYEGLEKRITKELKIEGYKLYVEHPDFQTIIAIAKKHFPEYFLKTY